MEEEAQTVHPWTTGPHALRSGQATRSRWVGSVIWSTSQAQLPYQGHFKSQKKQISTVTTSKQLAQDSQEQVCASVSNMRAAFPSLSLLFVCFQNKFGKLKPTKEEKLSAYSRFCQTVFYYMIKATLGTRSCKICSDQLSEIKNA